MLGINILKVFYSVPSHFCLLSDSSTVEREEEWGEESSDDMQQRLFAVNRQDTLYLLFF